MTNERFFYHSFPRSKKESDANHAQGLAVLESILDRGLLLAPEVKTFREHRQGGTQGSEWEITQKRICFTELGPSELPAHAETFGAFALEFEIDTLRAMGAIPTFYVPMYASPDSLEGVGAAMLARLGEMELVLNRLHALREAAGRAPPNGLIHVTGAATRATAGGVEDLLAYLSADTQSIGDLEAALKWTSGLVYPVDDPHYPGPLRYYRQREWKILANMVRDGVAVTRKPSTDEMSALLALDSDFFGKQLEIRGRTTSRADQCQLYSSFRDKPIVTFVHRIIAPASAINGVIALLESRGLNLAVTTLESLSD